MRCGRDVLVLGFGDLADPAALQPQILAALAPPDVTCVLAGADWPAAGTAQLDALAALVQTKRWLICVGVGAGGFGALYFGKLLGASAIFAAALGVDDGPWIGAEDLDDLTALFSDPDLQMPGQQLRLVSTEDSRIYDLAVVERLRGAGVDVAVDHAALPSEAAALALAQSSVWASQLAAWLDDTPIPDSGEVAARWRRAFAHTLEIDVAAAYQDTSGALHLSGRLFNQSPGAFDLAMASAQRVRIGARLRGREGRVLEEGRAGFTAGGLEPGHSSPFRIVLPSLPADAGALEVALVCDGRFWFDTIGFPLITFSLVAEPKADGPSAAFPSSDLSADEQAQGYARTDTVLVDEIDDHA